MISDLSSVESIPILYRCAGAHRDQVRQLKQSQTISVGDTTSYTWCTSANWSNDTPVNGDSVVFHQGFTTNPYASDDIPNPYSQITMNETIQMKKRITLPALVNACYRRALATGSLLALLGTPLMAQVVLHGNFGNPNVLEIQVTNPSTPSASGAKWAAEICHNSTWLSGSQPPFEWIPVLNPAPPLEDKVSAVLGTASNSALSTDDVWFTHPFGFDWATDVIWVSNPEFDGLMAPGQAQPTEPKGFLHVEMDADFVPPYYRAANGDAVAVFGRWIVDCGHDDFQSEIHPPLMFVRTARGANGTTHTTITSRPFIITEKFSGDSLYDWIIKQGGEMAAKSLLPPVGIALIDDHFTARPQISPMPFSGVQLMIFTIRPQNPKPSADALLMAHYQLTVRSGVGVSLHPAGDVEGSVVVWVAMSDSAYHASPLPPKQNVTISLDQIKQHNQLGPWIDAVQSSAAFIVANPAVAAVLQRGVQTDRYQTPAPATPTTLKSLTVSMTPGTTNDFEIVTDDNQPYPFLGTIDLEWVQPSTSMYHAPPSSHH